MDRSEMSRSQKLALRYLAAAVTLFGVMIVFGLSLSVVSVFDSIVRGRKMHAH